MNYILEDTSKVEALFAGWEETLIYSCLLKVMGKIFVRDVENPKSAMAYVGCFAFVAGEPNQDLLLDKPEGFAIVVPQNEEWATLIESTYKNYKRFTRYATRKDTKFDISKLKENINKLPSGLELKKIDGTIYDLCLKKPMTYDFVSVFGTKENYLKLGRGRVILKDGEIIAGASSYTRYNEGIEIEVDTKESERRKGLARIVCSALILDCLEEGLYPSWDAQNKISLHMAETLGYEFSHEYTAFEVDIQ